ncbi:methyltransferase domain-containing protein [Microbacterium kyungheense]|uniref:2-polyprenyl-3-methyl-5-hydroxy-6-metoxy-1, 4-benzoquinol methylase n=1 Tax=Microbacterium kyungheense TaxID=1263636 RepID=A0A543EAH8_9MICO|nr:methyltransferase domain-containing protein [Microbacterium kyungheense]TQM18536.1 2-polyprenyl-3-methyl-5-hydroxy-6-metoxy-1,4-benzoquinol methylase [Microbacterium kyungheense]
MSLAVRDDALVELMDDPACDAGRLHATLQRFGTINRLVSGWGRTYRTWLRPHLAALGRPARVLDIGSGGGDLVARLAVAARRDGFDVAWTGIDPDPRAHAVAMAREALPGVTFRRADAAALIAEGAVFDAVLSNHVLHHLGAALPAFADESLALSRGIVLHSDIERSRLAYGLYAVGITPFAPGTFLRTDGLRSIRRSYTRTELAATLDEDRPGVWSVVVPAPFRVLAVGRGRA